MNNSSNNNKKWYHTNVGIIAVLVLFFPLGIYYMWRYGTWKTASKWKVTGGFLLFILVFNALLQLSPSSKKYNTQQQLAVATADNNASPTQVPTVIPTAKPQTPEEIFESICQKYGGTDNCVYTKDGSGKWAVAQIIQYKSDAFMFTSAKQNSRDFIFAIYATKLPIAHVAISNNYYEGGKYYRAGLGVDVASTQPDSTWTNNDVGPSIFYDFLEGHTNGTSGDRQNSTYVETNLN